MYYKYLNIFFLLFLHCNVTFILFIAQPILCLAIKLHDPCGPNVNDAVEETLPLCSKKEASVQWKSTIILDFSFTCHCSVGYISMNG